MSDPNGTISPAEARRPLGRPPAQTNVGKVTQGLREIPPEKLAKKVGRTVAGALLLYAGLKGAPVLKAADIWHAKEVASAAVIGGAVMMSFEFVVTPLNYLVALAKDIASIVIRVMARKNGAAS